MAEAPTEKVLYYGYQWKVAEGDPVVLGGRVVGEVVATEPFVEEGTVGTRVTIRLNERTPATKVYGSASEVQIGHD